MQALISALAFLTVIIVLVFIHEWGHYRVAIACGVKVLKFSIGFGPVLWSRTDRRGVEWAISAIPLGGFVRMVDQREGDVPEEDLRRAFDQQSLLKRALIVVAGPLANLLFAVLLYALLALIGTQEATPIFAQPDKYSVAADLGFQDGDQAVAVRIEDSRHSVQSWEQMQLKLLSAWVDGESIAIVVMRGDGEREFPIPLAPPGDDEVLTGELLSRVGLHLQTLPPRIESLEPSLAAERDGLQVGDRILAINSRKVAGARELIEIIRANPDNPLSVEVLRGQRELVFSVTPNLIKSEQGTFGRIGATLGSQLSMHRVERSLAESLVYGFRRTWDYSTLTLKVVGKMLTAQMSVRNVSGPIAVADIAGRAAVANFEVFIGVLAIISVSLGVLNLLPIPILDGGQLVLLGAEVVLGRPVSENTLARLQQLGVFCLLALMGIALFNDVYRIVIGT